MLAAGLLGWRLPAPARLLDRHQAISIVLAALVFASAMTVPAGAAHRVRTLAARLTLVITTAAIVLPALAFALSRLVSAAALRDAVLAVGVAPSEVASVAVAGIAGGDAAAAAGLLVASTLVCVVTAGPILALAGGRHVSAAGVLVSLALVVGLPLLAGLAARRALARRAGPRFPAAGERAALGSRAAAVVAVAVLVWLISGQVRLSAAYGRLVAVLAAFVLASAALAVLLSWRTRPPARVSIVLTVSMRDFAVASGIASAAFGPAAAAPLGIYAVLVLAWGSADCRAVGQPPASASELIN